MTRVIPVIQVVLLYSSVYDLSGARILTAEVHGAHVTQPLVVHFVPQCAGSARNSIILVKYSLHFTYSVYQANSGQTCIYVSTYTITCNNNTKYVIF